MSEPTTILVPTINARPDLLQACLNECERTMRDGDRLLVIEGGTFAKNINAGMSIIQTETAILLNDDCKPDDDEWIDNLLAPIDDDDEIGVVGCRLIYPTGRIQHAGVYLTIDDGLLMGHHYLHDRPAGPVTAVTAACMAVRTSLFHALSGLDESFRNGNEDVDFCLRVRESGNTVWYTPEATVIHHESQSGPARWQFVSENVFLLNERWLHKAQAAEPSAEVLLEDGAPLPD